MAPRYREGDPEPEGVPAPTQARADFIKAKVHGLPLEEVDPDPLLPPQNKDVPMVWGPAGIETAAVGETLSCTMGNWTGEPTSYSYAWQSGSESAGSDAPDYLVAATDAGKQIVCIVTATNAHGSTAAPPSNAVSIP